MKISISGIRGIFGKDFTLKDVLQYCNSFSTMIKSKKCVIGTDTRPTGSMVKETASAALLQCGIDVYDLGVVPTPVVFREARKYSSGLVVTSSHNPLEWNGLKFVLDGRGINEEELQDLKKEHSTDKSKIGSETKAGHSYIDDAYKIIGKINDPPNVVVDIGGGAAQNVAPKLLEKIGCKVQTINDSIRNSSRDPDPTTDSLNSLIKSTGKDHIGFAFDLDADRLVVVYEGKKQSPDVTLGLGVAKSLELGYKKYVLSIDTSLAVERFITLNGGTVERTKVGEANVIDMMLKKNADAGGEGSSAGFILPEFNYCRDGILTSGLIASMVGSETFNEILEFISEYHQDRDKIQISSDLHDKTLEKLYQKMKEMYSEIITIDGIKAIVDEDTWVLIRKSNTEDIIRVSTEGKDTEKIKQVKKQVFDLIKS